jgi:hypothetical protein
MINIQKHRQCSCTYNTCFLLFFFFQVGINCKTIFLCWMVSGYTRILGIARSLTAKVNYVDLLSLKGRFISFSYCNISLKSQLHERLLFRE